MTNSNLPAQDDSLENTPQAPAAPVPTLQIPASVEAKEAEPQLLLQVAGSCNSAGKFVGLNKKQRDALGVTPGGSVEIFQEGQSLGRFTVGAGSSEHINTDRFTANGVSQGQVTVKKAKDSSENVISYGVSHGIESTIDQGRHAQRLEIIRSRFPQQDPESYMTLPIPTMNQLLGESLRKPSISEVPVRFAGKEVRMVVVPAGENIGFTTKAAARLGIPAQLTSMRIRIENGEIIVD